MVPRAPGVDSPLFDEFKGRLILAARRFDAGLFGEAVVFYKQARTALCAPKFAEGLLNSETKQALAYWRCHAEECVLVAQDRHEADKRLVSKLKNDKRNPEQKRTHHRKKRARRLNERRLAKEEGLVGKEVVANINA